jgi:hypothetical protein
MILDDQNMFSDSQVLTVTANSTNVIDQNPLGGIPTANLVRDIGTGNDVYLYAVCRTTFAGGTSLAVSLVSDDNSALSSPTIHFTSAAIALAALVAGFEFKVEAPPGLYERFIGVVYTIVGTMSGGSAISAYLVSGGGIEQIRYYRDARVDNVT